MILVIHELNEWIEFLEVYSLFHFRYLKLSQNRAFLLHFAGSTGQRFQLHWMACFSIGFADTMVLIQLIYSLVTFGLVSCSTII